MTTPHRVPQGADVVPGGVRFRLWAPNCSHIAVETRDGAEPAHLVSLLPTGGGWHEGLVPQAHAGTRYQYILPDGMRVPDPASRYQPDDAHGASEVIDPGTYAWSDAAWLGRPWHEAVLYELHVGAFTPEGTFRAARERLDHLVTLGVTAIEIMPVADFPGRRNWGYDGVLLYAPDSTYGRPEDLMALVDAAHARGLMVLLDVVYNHFGPDGNYLPLYAPAFFSGGHRTPWGAGVNFDGPESTPVREFIIHNALYWLDEFHLDGLRLDAVHAILDDSPCHILDELAGRVRAASRREVHLVLENEENRTRWLVRGAHGRPLHYTAHWNDDVHHVLHVAATGERQGYYAKYAGDTKNLARALAEGFAHWGETSTCRDRPYGEPSGALPPTAFVAFIQNHDQIGNRAFGDRLSTLAPPAVLRALAAVYLLSPQIPMLFMGEEWHSGRPFPFFCDFGGDLAEAVRNGRRREFARFPEFQSEAARDRIPDPQSDSTFASAKLDWTDLENPEHRVWFDLYRRLLARRREAIVPLLPGMGGYAATYEVVGPSAVTVRWRYRRGAENGVLTLDANFADKAVIGFRTGTGRTLWKEGGTKENAVGEPWSVRWSLEPAA